MIVHEAVVLQVQVALLRVHQEVVEGEEDK
jgi:hypothetical protein